MEVFLYDDLEKVKTENTRISKGEVCVCGAHGASPQRGVGKRALRVSPQRGMGYASS